MDEMFRWLLTAVSVVVFLGAAAVYLRGSRDKGTIATLTSSNAALTERVSILETDKKTDRARIVALEQANGVLEGVANSSEVIAAFREEMVGVVGALVASLGNHHTQAMEGIATLHGDLVALKETP